MHLKRALLFSILSILLNAISLYNAVLAGWSLVLLIFSIFSLHFRDKVQLPRDMKVYGFIQLFMLIVITFMSTAMGAIGFYQLWFIIQQHFSPIVPVQLSIALAAVGTVLYYYLLLTLIRESYAVFKLRIVRSTTIEEPQETQHLEKKTYADQSSKVKARYIILLIIVSLIINFLSVYNFYLGICSIFVLLITSITALINTLVNRVNKIEPKRRGLAQHNLSQYGTLKTTQAANKIGLVFGIIIVYVGGVLFTFLQFHEREQLHQFLSTHVEISNVHAIANTLSIIGYALFVLSLIFMTIYCIRVMRSGQMFVGKNN